MSYNRTIPRDLFNEANLLKCYGQLYLQLEKIGMEDRLQSLGIDKGFQVEQDYASGGLLIQNVMLVVNGENVFLFRPLNARDPYPLYAIMGDEEEISVFNDDGTFTDEMKAFLNA